MYLFVYLFFFSFLSILNLPVPRNTKKSKAIKTYYTLSEIEFSDSPNCFLSNLLAAKRNGKEVKRWPIKKGCSRLVSDLEFHIWKGGKSKGSVLPFRCGKVSMFYK